jgi:hypothetical protein
MKSLQSSSSSLQWRIFTGIITAGLLLYSLSYYLPLPPRGLFLAGIVLPGLLWLIWSPKALGGFLQAYIWVLLPLALIQILNMESWQELKLWFYFVGFLACCTLLDRTKKLEAILTVFAWASLTVLAWSAMDWWLIHQSTGEWVRYGVLFGRAVDPIDTALVISTGLLYLWLYKVEPRLRSVSKWHVMAGFLVLSSLILLISTVYQARTLLVAYALFLLVYLFARRFWLLGSTVILAVVLLSYLMGADQLLLQRGLSYRPEIWSDALNRVSHVCGIWIGCGKDGYRFLHMYTHTHNFLLQILYEDGVLGLFIFTILAAYLIKHGRHSNALLWATLGVGGQLTNTGWLLTPPKAIWVYFWLPVTMLTVEISREKLHGYWIARRGLPDEERTAA